VRLDAHFDFLGFESWHLGTKGQLLLGFLHLDQNGAKQLRLGTQPIIDIMTGRFGQPLGLIARPSVLRSLR
jgi:hypothetical protein